MAMEPPLIEGHIEERGHRTIVVGKVLPSDVEAVHTWMKDRYCRSKLPSGVSLKHRRRTGMTGSQGKESYQC